MDKLRALQYLVKVADTLSFSRAARAFGVPASSISRRISDLEAELGVALLHRTTRTVRLTELGALYLEQVRAGIAQLTDADELVGQRSSTPSGTLRISAMPSYGQLLLMPALQDFADRYPEIVLDVHLSDALVDLGRDQIDIAIRGGRQPQDRIVARKLDPNRFMLAASPRYLAEHGTPQTLDDLQHHRALMYRGPNAVIKWQGLDEDGWREVPVTPAFISNDGSALLAMARQHRGLVLLSEWGLRTALHSGELVPVPLAQPLSVNRGGEAGIYLLYLQTRYQIPKVRVAVEFLLQHLGRGRAKTHRADASAHANARYHARSNAACAQWLPSGERTGAHPPEGATAMTTTATTTAATTTRRADNGVNVDALLAARAALTDAPEGAQFTWRATSQWVNGTHSRATVDGFFGLGQEQRHRRSFDFDVDHPEIFAATDNGATPVELMLVGLAGCLSAGIASVAQHRNLQLHSVRATLEAGMDLQGVLGIDAQVRNGFDGIRVHYEIDADATPEQIAALVAQSQKRSAVFDIIANPTDIRVTASKA